MLRKGNMLQWRNVLEAANVFGRLYVSQKLDVVETLRKRAYARKGPMKHAVGAKCPLKPGAGGIESVSRAGYGALTNDDGC